jgi:hypothetical protein
MELSPRRRNVGHARCGERAVSAGDRACRPGVLNGCGVRRGGSGRDAGARQRSGALGLAGNLDGLTGDDGSVLGEAVVRGHRPCREVVRRGDRPQCLAGLNRVRNGGAGGERERQRRQRSGCTPEPNCPASHRGSFRADAPRRATGVRSVRRLPCHRSPVMSAESVLSAVASGYSPASGLCQKLVFLRAPALFSSM